MKVILCFLLSVSFAFAQAPDKETLSLYLPKGKEMAKQAYLAQGGAPKINTYRKVVYTMGPLKGLTRAAALEKFEETWAKSPAETRLLWAKRAMATGTTEIAKPASAGRSTDELLEESRRRSQERRLQELERIEHDRKVRGR